MRTKQPNSGPPENGGLGSLPSAPEFGSLQVRTRSEPNTGSEPKNSALRMITFKSITYYDQISPVFCLTRTTHHNPSLSSGPAFSFSLAVLSAAHIVRLLVKHLIDGNTKAKPENSRPHKFGVAPLFLRSGSVGEFHSDILSNRRATVLTA